MRGPLPGTLAVEPEPQAQTDPCRIDPDLFFPDTYGVKDAAAVAAAKALCHGCPKRLDCLTTALETPERYGIWGGTTPRERDWLRAARANEPPTVAPKKSLPATVTRSAQPAACPSVTAYRAHKAAGVECPKGLCGPFMRNLAWERRQQNPEAARRKADLDRARRQQRKAAAMSVPVVAAC